MEILLRGGITGRGGPINLLDFIDVTERKLGKKAIRHYLDMQPGDVTQTFAELIAA